MNPALVLVPAISAATGAVTAASAQCSGAVECPALFGIVLIMVGCIVVLSLCGALLYTWLRDRR